MGLVAHGTAVGQPHVDLEDMPHVRGARHELSRPDAAANAGEAAATMGAQPAVAVEIDVGHAAIPDQRRKSAEGAWRAPDKHARPPDACGLVAAHRVLAELAGALCVDAAALNRCRSSGLAAGKRLALHDGPLVRHQRGQAIVACIVANNISLPS